MADRLKWWLTGALLIAPFCLLIWRPDTFGPILQEMFLYPRDVAWLLLFDALYGYWAFTVIRPQHKLTAAVLVFAVSTCVTLMYAWKATPLLCAASLVVPTLIGPSAVLFWGHRKKETGA